jgi:hypothetical protein
MAARAAAARCGEAGVGQRGPGKRRCGCWGGTWSEEGRRGGNVCSAHGRRGRRGVGQRENRAEGLEVDEGDLVAIS